jgi:hypothetical protein
MVPLEIMDSPEVLEGCGQQYAAETLHGTLPSVPEGHDEWETRRQLAGPLGQLSLVGRTRTIRCMKKRLFAAFLWFNAGWYAGAMLAEVLSLSPALGPIIGVAAAGLIFADPFRRIWTARAAAPKSIHEAMPEPV